MSSTKYLSKKMVDQILNVSTFTCPTCYLGLGTSVPNRDGVWTEVSAAGYQRMQIGFQGFNGPFSYQIINSTGFQFPTAVANWGTLQGWAVFDAQGGGNMLFGASLPISYTINAGDWVAIPAGSLVYDPYPDNYVIDITEEIANHIFLKTPYNPGSIQLDLNITAPLNISRPPSMAMPRRTRLLGRLPSTR